MTIKELKIIINNIRTRDDDKPLFYDGRPVTDIWWIDCSDGYVIGIETENEIGGYEDD